MHKVLLVDDDRTLTGLLQMLLELDGFDVAVTGRADDVLPAIERETPDALVMDVHIGGTDSTTLVRQIRAIPALTKLPIIMVSGMDKSYECRQAGADDFILKPYPPEQITASLNKLLAN